MAFAASEWPVATGSSLSEGGVQSAIEENQKAKAVLFEDSALSFPCRFARLRPEDRSANNAHVGEVLMRLRELHITGIEILVEADVEAVLHLACQWRGQEADGDSEQQ